MQINPQVWNFPQKEEELTLRKNQKQEEIHKLRTK